MRKPASAWTSAPASSGMTHSGASGVRCRAPHPPHPCGSGVPPAGLGPLLRMGSHQPVQSRAVPLPESCHGHRRSEWHGCPPQSHRHPMAYGFPAANNSLTLTSGVAVALSPDSRSYGILWSLAPYTRQGQTEPWEIALEGEREESNSATSPVDHSLMLSFSLPF